MTTTDTTAETPADASSTDAVLPREVRDAAVAGDQGAIGACVDHFIEIGDPETATLCVTFGVEMKLRHLQAAANRTILRCDIEREGFKFSNPAVAHLRAFLGDSGITAEVGAGAVRGGVRYFIVHLPTDGLDEAYTAKRLADILKAWSDYARYTVLFENAPLTARGRKAFELLSEGE
jgi:hypothetical protein